MITTRNLLATLVLGTMTIACGVPVPFEYESDPQTADVDQLLGENTFTVPEGAPGGMTQEDVEDLVKEYFADYADSENWPDELNDLKLDVPLLETFPVDLNNNESVRSVVDRISAVAVDRLEVEFLQNSINYAIPSFHFFTVQDGVTMPSAEEFDMANPGDGITQIGTMTGVEARTTGSFALVYAESGKQTLSDMLKSLKFNVAIFTTLTFDTQQEGGLVPSGAVQVKAHIAGRMLTDN